MKILFIFLTFCTISYSQNNISISDTLYIEINKDCLTREYNPVEDFYFYKIKNSGNNGFILLEEKRIFERKSPLSFITCKDLYDQRFLIKNSNIYCRKIDDWSLAKSFFNKKIILFDGNKLITVSVSHEIE